MEALIGLGLIACDSGQYPAAHTFLGEAVAIARESDCRGNLAAGLAALARTERRCGNLALSLVHASEATRIAEEIGWPVIQMWGELETGLTRLSQGDPETALVHTRRAVDLAPKCDESWIGSEQVYRAHSRVLRAAAHIEAANEAERLADKIVKAKADRIPDAEQRQCYFEFASRDS